MDLNFTATFVTPGTDTTDPVFASSVPADEATDVSVNATVRLTFTDANPISLGASVNFYFYEDGVLSETVATSSCSINAGVVTVPHANFTNEATVSVRWDAGVVEDAAGNTVAANTTDTLVNFSIIAAGAGESTSNGTTATYNTTSFTWSGNLDWGSFANTGFPNHLFVVAPSGLTLTATSPATQTVGSDLAYGVMANPNLSGGASQGWDQLLADDAFGVPYSDSLNLDPSKPGGSSQAIATNTSLVKALRRSGVTTSQYYMFSGYVVLHVLDAVPALNSYPPSMTAATKRMFSRADVDTSIFRSMTFTLPNTPSSLLSQLPQDCAEFGASRADGYRFLRQDSGVNGAGTNYSGDYTHIYGQALMALNNAVTTTQERQDIMDRLIGWGIQTLGLVAEGGDLGGGAGQGGGFTGYCYLAALALNDATYLADAKGIQGQMHAPFWISSEYLEFPSLDKTGVHMQTFFDEHVGMPHTLQEGVNTNHDNRYIDSGIRNTIWETYGVAMLDQNTSGVSGLDAILNGATQNDTSNDRAALIAFPARVRQMQDWRHNRDPISFNTIWDSTYAILGITPWTGQPDQMPNSIDSLDLENFFSTGSGAGEIDWDITAYDYATETVTDVEVRYAIDNGEPPVQFIESTGHGNTGTLSGLMRGGAYWCGIRKVSASGKGPWSANYPRSQAVDGSVGRDKITTTGSEANAAPVNTVAPTIHRRFAPGWNWKAWKGVTGALGINEVELACGLGDWTGFPYPTFSNFQWYRDGVAISGATTQYYTRTVADAGAVLTCSFEATNSQGTQSVTTAGVTAPTLTVLPSGTLVDTDFKQGFAIDYEAEAAAITTVGNATGYSHEPTESAGALAGIDVGLIRPTKSGSGTVAIDIPLQQQAVAGTTYSLLAQILTYFNYTNSADGFVGTLQFSIRNASGTEFYVYPGLTPAEAKRIELDTIDTTFTVPGGESDLDLIARIGGTGLGAGVAFGWGALSRLRVVAQ